jgi:hypothetical protein
MGNREKSENEISPGVSMEKSREGEVIVKRSQDVTPEFQKKIHEEIRKYWMGRGEQKIHDPQSSYEKCWLKIVGGIPILVTAPHAVPHDRGREKLKDQDDNTDLVVMEVCRLASCYGLIPLKPLADPNRLHKERRAHRPPIWKSTREVSFFQEAERMVKERKIEFLIDVHGIRDHHRDSVVIGKAGAKGKEEWAAELQEHLQQHGIPASIDFTQTRDGRGRNLSGGDFVRNISIPALQLELKPKQRFGEGLHHFSQILVAFLGRKAIEQA